MSDKNKLYTAEDVLAVADLLETKQDDDSFWEQYATLDDQMKICNHLLQWHLESVKPESVDTVEGFQAALEASIGYVSGFFAGVHAERNANAGTDSK